MGEPKSDAMLRFGDLQAALPVRARPGQEDGQVHQGAGPWNEAPVLVRPSHGLQTLPQPLRLPERRGRALGRGDRQAWFQLPAGVRPGRGRVLLVLLWAGEGGPNRVQLSRQREPRVWGQHHPGLLPQRDRGGHSQDQVRGRYRRLPLLPVQAPRAHPLQGPVHLHHREGPGGSLHPVTAGGAVLRAKGRQGGFEGGLLADLPARQAPQGPFQGTDLHLAPCVQPEPRLGQLLACSKEVLVVLALGLGAVDHRADLQAQEEDRGLMENQ
mmetsp:Transcript_4979/g.17909  ORF Transcript_4979/g.17909 Transcript_4979/m.17909 type:complete len:269 (+) Transcript_4979:468-1274(+)